LPCRKAPRPTQSRRGATRVVYWIRPQAILVATAYRKREKMRLSLSTGRAWASFAPKGAVNTEAQTIPTNAGR